MPTSSSLQPTYFICHGNPKWIVTPDSVGPKFLARLGRRIAQSPNRPRAIVMVSAHWETFGEIRVTTRAEHGKLLYDYYGFPSEYYKIEYPAKGDVEVAGWAKELLQSKGYKVTNETARGLDHGVFTPMMYMFPERDIPIVVISLPRTDDLSEFIRLGEALRPLRSRNVLIMGGGYATHNLMDFRRIMSLGVDLDSIEDKPLPVPDWASSFSKALEAAVVEPGTYAERKQRLLALGSNPNYLKSHPSPEHLAPVFVAAGASLDENETGGAGEKVTKIHDAFDMSSFSQMSFAFGDVHNAAGAAESKSNLV
ncbi:hypothetical protein HDU96_010457 [Phlyctochytrium bullatum]|nr:hypothetical protein HDU96_010457 [Phlyctochytrium bullatum]